MTTHDEDGSNRPSQSPPESPWGSSSRGGGSRSPAPRGGGTSGGGSGGTGGGNNPNPNQNPNQRGKQNPGGGTGGGGNDFDNFIRRGKDNINRLVPNNFRGGRAFFIGMVVVIGLWLLSGFYRVNTQQEGVVLRFGEWVETTTPGLHYHLPYPIESVLKPEVTRDNRINIGFRSSGGTSGRRDIPFESQMITGDENIVDIDFVVFWRIGDAGNFLFNLTDPEETTKVAAEAIMREIVGRVDIQFALTDGRDEIQRLAKQQLQSLLDEYSAGVTIRDVQLLAVDPPVDVIDAFNEVQRARQDRDRLKNEAEAYSNDVIPRARGDAARIVAESEAYAAQIVNQAEGDASRFTQIYEAYRTNRDVTSERIYIETLEEVMRNVDKIIIDEGATNTGVLPYLPLPELGSRTPQNDEEVTP